MNESSEKASSARLLPSFGSLLAGLSIVIATIPLALFVFSLLGRYFFFAELVGNFRCQIMVTLIPFAILFLGVRRWWFGALTLIALAWSMTGIVWVCLPVNQPPQGPKPMKVMSFNLLVQNQQHAEVIRRIVTEDPDVVTILEYASHWHEALAALDEQYPYSVKQPRWHGFGMAIFSKHPLTDTQVVNLTEQKTDNPMIVTKVNFGEQIIRVVGVHTLSPTNRFRLDIRNRQFVEIGDALLAEATPTVVMGDFNCTPWSPFLSDFLKRTGYRDSRQGFGYQPSWPSMYQLLRIPIDHAFVSCLLYTSPSPRDRTRSRMPSSA